MASPGTPQARFESILRDRTNTISAPRLAHDEKAPPQAERDARPLAEPERLESELYENRALLHRVLREKQQFLSRCRTQSSALEQAMVAQEVLIAELQELDSSAAATPSAAAAAAVTASSALSSCGADAEAESHARPEETERRFEELHLRLQFKEAALQQQHLETRYFEQQARAPASLDTRLHPPRLVTLLTTRSVPRQVCLLRRQLASQQAMAATDEHDGRLGSMPRPPTPPPPSPPQREAEEVKMLHSPAAPVSDAPSAAAAIPATAPEPAAAAAPEPEPEPEPEPACESAEAAKMAEADATPPPAAVAAPPDECPPPPPQAEAAPPQGEVAPHPVLAAAVDAGSLALAAPSVSPGPRAPRIAAPSSSRVFVSCTGFSAAERRALQRAAAALGANYSADLTDLTTHLVAPSGAVQVWPPHSPTPHGPTPHGPQPTAPRPTAPPHALDFSLVVFRGVAPSGGPRRTRLSTRRRVRSPRR